MLSMAHIPRALFADLCIMVWIHMVAYEYIYNFSKFKKFCILVDRFCDPVFSSVLVRVRFLGSAGSTTSSVFVTLVEWGHLVKDQDVKSVQH